MVFLKNWTALAFASSAYMSFQQSSSFTERKSPISQIRLWPASQPPNRTQHRSFSDIGLSVGTSTKYEQRVTNPSDDIRRNVSSAFASLNTALYVIAIGWN